MIRPQDHVVIYIYCAYLQCNVVIVPFRMINPDDGFLGWVETTNQYFLSITTSSIFVLQTLEFAYLFQSTWLWCVKSIFGGLNHSLLSQIGMCVYLLLLILTCLPIIYIYINHCFCCLNHVKSLLLCCWNRNFCDILHVFLPLWFFAGQKLAFRLKAPLFFRDPAGRGDASWLCGSPWPGAGRQSLSVAPPATEDGVAWWQGVQQEISREILEDFDGMSWGFYGNS